MFEIKLNDCIKSQLKKLPVEKSSENIEKEGSSNISEQEIERYFKNDSIPMGTLLQFYTQYWRKEAYPTMKQLLSPLEYKFKEKRKPGQNYSKEFKAQLNMLKLKQEEDAYQNLVHKKNNNNSLFNVKEGDDLDLSPAQINAQIKEQVTTIFNILISVISVVFAIWYWTGTSMRIEVQYRILLCLFFGILVLVAEVVVYNSYLTKIDDAKTTERAIVEKKKVIKKL